LADFVVEVGCEFVLGGLFFEPAETRPSLQAAGTLRSGCRTRRSRDALGRPIRGTKRQFGDAAQVLGNGCERELELCPGRATQS
jgi:hypothetical protein